MPMNAVCHIEFPVTDFARARSFFGAIFGWSFRDLGDMVVFGSSESHVGGFAKVATPVPSSFTSIWIEVEDIDSTLVRVEAAGGEVLRPRGHVHGVGWSAEFADHDGNAIGIVQFESISD